MKKLKSSKFYKTQQLKYDKKNLKKKINMTKKTQIVTNLISLHCENNS